MCKGNTLSTCFAIHLISNKQRTHSRACTISHCRNEGFSASFCSRPGVQGRMTQLAKVVESRYQLAMAVVLGRDIDSVRVHAQIS